MENLILDQDLSSCQLKSEMKSRLVEEAFKPESSFGIVAKRTNLKRERVLSFKKELINGKALFPGKGRPTKLGHISISNLVDVIRSEPGI